MRVYNSGTTTVIDQDEDIVSKAVGVDMNAPYWEYVNLSGEVVRVDVSAHRTNMEVLAGLYRTAGATKQPEDAAAYVRHKARVLALLN